MQTPLQLATSALALAAFNLSAATLYVSLESTNPVPPYATWGTAANIIQDAVDTAQAGDTVLVTNGVYSVGVMANEWGVVMGRVAITNAIRLESVNGPLVTSIEGAQILNENGNPTDGMRCVFLGSNAVISGFTLTNGFACLGGGIFCEPSAVVTNCILRGNSAPSSHPPLCGGGGACGGILYNCTLEANWAGNRGGGAINSTLYNCTLTDNLSLGFGPVDRCTLHKCTLTNNRRGTGGTRDPGGTRWSTLYDCTLTGNSGGAWDSTLHNCTLMGNGWGADFSTLNNCTLSGNGSGAYGSTLYNSDPASKLRPRFENGRKT